MSANPSKQNARTHASAVLEKVLNEGASLNKVLPQQIAMISDKNMISLVSALSYGVLRWYFRLEYFLKELLPRPLRKRDENIRLLLLIGLYQLMEQRVPDYAAVSESVNTADSLSKSWAKGVINAVLRRFIREREMMMQAMLKQELVHYSTPAWLLGELKHDWPDNWSDLLDASNQQAPMFLRVNLKKISSHEYLNRLQESGIQAQAVDQLDCAIRLKTACDVLLLPGFDQGMVSVQDLSAQYAAYALAPQAGDVILDACAAPGGKTAHLLEMQPALKRLYAIEISAERSQQINENLARIDAKWQDKVCVINGDINQADHCWDHLLYDRILLDVPCSATGVIRRHPDIKHLRKHDDIQSLVATQADMIQSVWRLLKPGGLLVYSTCSILKRENEIQVLKFLENCSDAGLSNLEIPGAIPRSAGYQILTGIHGGDGFYYAGITKNF